MRAILWGLLGGCALGVLGSALWAIWMAMPTTKTPNWAWLPFVAVPAVGLVGGSLGAAFGQLSTMRPERQAWYFKLAALAGLACYPLALIVSLFLLAGTDLGLWSISHSDALFVVPIFATVGAWAAVLCVGAVAHAEQAREQEESNTMLLRLEAERAELETPIKGKFGHLTLAWQDRVQSWDFDQLAEARRRLPSAGALDELAGPEEGQLSS
jgi:hypothetical protein